MKSSRFTLSHGSMEPGRGRVLQSEMSPFNSQVHRLFTFSKCQILPCLSFLPVLGGVISTLHILCNKTECLARTLGQELIPSNLILRVVLISFVTLNDRPG